ncbi:trypsin-like peptidase domain-containing protein [Candidatus Collierbacteria bacterium]|nr:trypsin-like peptidase domain-containing protein [Candidatus Collierbacteria bacterium]
MKNFLVGLSISVIVIFSAIAGAIADRLFVFKPLDRITANGRDVGISGTSVQRVVTEENAVIEVAEKVSPAVVTVSIVKQQGTVDPFFFDPFGIFETPRNSNETIQRDIGSGFIISKDGLVVTNKHVVGDNQASYKVILKDNSEYEVKNIYRDPINDLSILKITPDKELMAVEMGDSSQLKVGQSVIAIGTALGEFRHTLTTGVISGLGRGIQAGGDFSGQAERLDNVIQTDAAINFGNSGGPLLNSVGQVVGVNVAIAGGAQNIGFAIPINVIKDSIQNFNETGKFERPMLGVSYRMINQQTALLNDVAEGALVVEVIAGSAADKSGIKRGDIIVKIDGEKIGNISGGLAAVIAKKKIGDRMELEIFKEGKTSKISVVLGEAR